MKNWRKIIAWKMAVWAGRVARGGWGSCSNRSWSRFQYGQFEVKIQFRNTDAPDTFSREELVQMLDTIRREERRTGWTVPEMEA